MTKILFVCHGNICRSPMAEFVMKDMLKKQGLDKCFYVASAATSSEELGNPPHRGARLRLEREGISCAGKTAVRLRKEDYAQYDYIIGMDEWNKRNMLRLFGGDPEHKISLLLEWAGEAGEVADPWYTGDFETTYQDVFKGCTAILSKLKNGKKQPGIF